MASSSAAFQPCLSRTRRASGRYQVNSAASPRGLPITWMPTGNPAFVNPTGSAITGHAVTVTANDLHARMFAEPVHQCVG